MSKLLIALGAALVVLALAPPALADTTLVVDKDRVQCPDADFQSIQAAVTAAQPGTTIDVCPDIYNEAVKITPLTTFATTDLKVVAKGKPEEVVLDGGGTLDAGFLLQDVSGILIKGFMVQRYHDDIVLNRADGNRIEGNVTTLAYGHDGILVTASDFNLITKNVSFGNLHSTSCGIGIGTGASFNTVEYNETYNNPNVGILLGGMLLTPAGPGNRILYNFSHDNGKPVPGASGGNGILNNAPETLIKDNRVTDNNRHGILVTGAVSQGVTIQDNRVFSNGSTTEDDGIRLDGGASNNLVVGNESRLNRHNGYHLVGAHMNVVRGNIAERNGSGAFGVFNGCGIDVTGSNGNVIEDNDVLAHDRAGIRLRSNSMGNRVSRNDVIENTGDGILLAGADFNTIEDNDSKKNGGIAGRGDGIRADSASEGNTIERNEMVDNVVHDCHDDTTGPFLPAATANFWFENSGKTQNRPGLCKDAVVTTPLTHP
jgi:parallel beta-helix repeat protein